ncbi:glyoxalase [Flavobacteriaceae bacterium]|nr:glyoxalase [Flavobacteriaceae bacterium]
MVFANMSMEERFQNETLRPILKLQNSLLLLVFDTYIKKRKGVFYSLNLEKRLAYIEDSLTKDQKFRNSMEGMVIGLFTVKEYNQYTLNSSALNKRMTQMIIERLKDQVQLFEVQL